MSGGSYNYLCFKELDQLLSYPGLIEPMFERLATLDGCSEIAKDTERFMTELYAFRDKMEPTLDKLQKIWKAVEWFDSNDIGEEGLEKAKTEYLIERG